MMANASEFQSEGLSERDVAALAELLALKARPGDCIALRGDLGAGKTTFARAFIRAMYDDPSAEVPSPTFAIAQTYPEARIPIVHYDWYRLAAAEELDEIGFGAWADADAIDVARADTPVALIEWPERAEHRLPEARIEVTLAGDFENFELRRVTIRAVQVNGGGVAGDRIARLTALWRARTRAGEIAGAAPARVRHLKGDASTRSYARLEFDAPPDLILMDAPAAPDGATGAGAPAYSAIAHLAENVDPFIAMAGYLKANGLSAPEVLHADREAGILLIEDLGDAVFDRIAPADIDRMSERWQTAVDALVALRAHGPAPSAISGHGVTHRLLAFDAGVMAAEVGLYLDWAWPAVRGDQAGPEDRSAYAHAWSRILSDAAAETDGLVLRDYHSPNLIWQPDRAGHARAGLIDFQDALRGSWAYDLVSLLQDARGDVPRDLHDRLFDHYCAQVSATDTAFDPDAFAAQFARLGAQRATKIIGIFHRLHRRDGKPAYLRHLPRVRSYLDRNLEHPSLAPVRVWFETTGQ